MQNQNQADPSFYDNMRLLKINETKARPIWNVEDICLMFGLSKSTFEITIRRTPLKGLFTIGRVRYCQQDAAYEWIRELEKVNAYEGQKRYNSKVA